jgi:hypothetical protein
MCTCSMRIACKPGSEVPEHLNLSRTPAPFLSARLTQSRVACVFACLSRPSTGTLTPPPPTNDAGAGRDLMANVTPGVRWLRSLGRYASDLAQWLWRTQPLLAVLAAICVSSFVWIVFSSCLEAGKTSDVIRALNYIRDGVNGDPKMLRIHGVNLSLGYEFDAEMFACGQSPLCVEVAQGAAFVCGTTAID